MNGRKSKQIRRMARAATTNFDAVSHPDCYVETPFVYPVGSYRYMIRKIKRAFKAAG